MSRRYSKRYSARVAFIVSALQSDTEQCLVWPFAVRKSSGYGAHNFTNGGNKTNVDAHRYVCELVNGPAPLRYEAAHACGKRTCINPRHLRWATHVENMADIAPPEVT